MSSTEGPEHTLAGPDNVGPAGQSFVSPLELGQSWDDE